MPSPPGAGDRAVLYKRVSAVMGRAGEEFMSPEIQEANGVRLCDANGWRIVEVVPDIDKSGRTFDREGLDRIRALAEARAFDVLVVADLNRFGRNLEEGLKFMTWLRQHGVEIASTKEDVQDQSANGKFHTHLHMALGQMYSDQISEQWRRVIEHRARNGRAHGRPPIGYRREVDPDAPPGRFGRRPSRIVVDPILGPIMAGIFTDYAAGWPIGQLAKRLLVRGKPVGLTHLRRMLAHPFYLGKVALWQQPQNAAKKPAAEAAVIAEGTHPALVDETTFRRVARRLRADSATYERRHLAMGWSLAGLAVCDACGLALSIKANKPHTRLRCNSDRRLNPTGCAGCGAPRLDEVEAVVLDRLDMYAARLRAATVVPAAVVDTAAQRDALEAELAANRAAQTKLVGEYARGRIPDHAYEATVADLVTEENRVRQRLSEVEDEEPPPSPRELARLVDEVREVWPDPDIAPTNRRMLLAAVVTRVQVRAPKYTREPYDQRVRVHFRW